MGILPTKGLTLPLMSYGRSSLIVTIMALGILLRIHHEVTVDASQPNRRRQRKPASARSKRK
jgi:cell division protein FtsW